MHNARELLDRAKDEGRLNEVMEILERSFGAQTQASSGRGYQAMTDASKRRRNPESEDDVDGSGEFDLVQPPVLQGGTSSKKARHDVNLPEGIPSLAKWGDTLCTLPKVAALQLSYSELADRADHDPNIMGYIEAFVLKYRGTSAKVLDLRRYLEATRYSTGCIYYEGTGEVRKFKE